MPYVSKRIPAIAAIVHVMRVEGCDRAAAMRQIETAALDGALRWVRRGSSGWDWDAEMFRTDVLKLWPKPPAEGDLPVQLGDAAAPAAGRMSDLRNDLKAAAAWHDQPMPDRAELQSLRVMRAKLRNTVQAAIQAREPADIAEDKCHEARKDVEGEILAWLADSQLAAFLDTQYGLERLPYGLYWASADGHATEKAKRVFAEGLAPSNHHPGLAGTVMVHAGDFELFAEQYLAARGLGKYRISSATPQRFEDPIWNQRDVFGWVLDRDPAKFGRIHTEGAWCSAEWAIKFYPTMPRPEHDPQAGQSILHALQKGDLVAYSGTSEICRDFWIDKTPQYIRHSSDFLFRREHVLALWPGPRAHKLRLPPPIKPLSGGRANALTNDMGSDSRVPDWRIWVHIPAAKLFEAVALSMSIDPQKLRHNPHSWMAGKRLFDEAEDFKTRLLLAERCLGKTLPGPVNWREQARGADPEVKLASFAEWAASVRWELPAELSKLRVGSRQSDPAEKASGRKHRGPAPGTLRRYEASDRALFSEIERLMQNDHISMTAAAIKLARGTVEGKKVEGTGTPESRAKRLVSLYRAQRGSP